MGDRLCPSDLHPGREHRGASLRRSQSPTADRPLTPEEDLVSTSAPISSDTAVKVETQKRQPLPPRERLEQVFEIQSLTAMYNGKPAVKDVTMEVYRNLVTA